MSFLDFFKRRGDAPQKKDDGLDEEHLQLRRAIERCDSLKFAVDAKQMSIADVIEKLLSNDFSKAVVKKAITECFGEAAEKHVR